MNSYIYFLIGSLVKILYLNYTIDAPHIGLLYSISLLVLFTFFFRKNKFFLLFIDSINSLLCIILIGYYRSLGILPQIDFLAQFLKLSDIYKTVGINGFLHFYNIPDLLLFFPFYLPLKYIKPESIKPVRIFFVSLIFIVSLPFVATTKKEVEYNVQKLYINSNKKLISLTGPLFYFLGLSFIKKDTKLTDTEINSNLNILKLNNTNHDILGKYLKDGVPILIIQLESAEAFTINKSNTPTIAKLLSNSIYFENIVDVAYGGNTADATLATIAGIFPMKERPISFSYPENNYPFTLPKILKKYGYKTKAFFPNNIWYWDTWLYTLGFDTVLITNKNNDQDHFNKVPDISKNNFFYICTIGTHMPYMHFNGNPYEEYLKKIKEMDKSIDIFLKRINKDVIIIFYGDHRGIHKYYPKESALIAQKDTIPFIIYYNKIEKQKIDKQGTTSDIHATIIDIFGIKDISSAGYSLFDKRKYDYKIKQKASNELVSTGHYKENSK